MTDVLTGAPTAAWYPDPSDPSLLRWWDGAGWSAHTMSRPDAVLTSPEELPAAAAKPIPEPMPFSSGLALGANDAGLRISEPPMLSPVDRAAKAELYGQLASSPTREPEATAQGFGDAPVRLGWDAPTPSAYAAPNAYASPNAYAFASMTETLPSSTFGAWALAFSQWLYVGVVAGSMYVALQLPQPLMPIVVFVILATLLPFVFAGLDRRRLGAIGHDNRPAVWWMLLGPLVYFIVRTVKLTARSRAAFVPLVVFIVNGVLIGFASGVASPFIAQWSLDFASKSVLPQVETSVAESMSGLPGAPYQVTCPDSMQPPILCEAVGSDGSTQSFEVVIDSAGGLTLEPRN